MKLVKPKKFLGQHFLKDLKVAQDIADTVDTFPELPILEVGPGMGVLTQFLVKKDRLVKVVEVDYESVAYLREAYPSLEDHIIEDDFLKMNLHRLFDGKPFVLTGNCLLYTSPIARRQRQMCIRDRVITRIIFPAKSFSRCWTTKISSPVARE